MLKKIGSWISNMRIFYKIMVPFILILLLLISMVYFSFISDKSSYLHNRKKSNAQSIITLIKSYTYLLETFDYQVLQANIDSIKKANNDLIYIYVVDENRRCIAGTSPELINTKIDVSIRDGVFQTAAPLTSEMETIGNVFVGINIKDIIGEIAYTRNVLISIAVIFMLLSVAIYRLITKKVILTPLSYFSAVTDSISEGDFPEIKEIQSQDEIGKLSDSLKKMLDFLKYIKTQANAIAMGNYTIDIKPRSEKDILGAALFTMKNNLIDHKKISDREDWIKSGLAELNNKIRGEQDIPTLTHNIINYLCQHLDAQIGAIYVEEDNILKMRGSYAYTKRKHLSNEFRYGEGLVGEAALEKETIILTDVPEDYIKIESGLGECSPRNIVVLPLLYENEVKGVIELGSLSEISDLKIDFLKQINDGIAISLNTAESRIKANKLLESTQNQAQELTVQQEELREMNEVLETQTETLKTSETKMQEQQEELRQTNEELEEQAKLMEKQKNYIQKKNDELKQAKKLLEQKAIELETGSRYKSQFLANMSHELRTPLNSLLLLSNLLAKNNEGNLNKKQEEYANTINNAGKDLLNLINDILDLSKIEAGKMELNIETVNLNNFTSNIERTFKPLIQEKKLDLIIEKASDLPEVFNTDRQRLEQIMKNLLSNALKFTSQGEIKVKVFRPDKTSRTFKDSLNSKYKIAISVSDTGIGIPEEKQQMLFEAFKQVDGSISRKYGGTGLGLAISREFSHLMGGEINLESEENKGSVFTLYLPLSPGESETEEIRTGARDKKEKGTESLKSEVEQKNKDKKFDLSDIRDDRRNISSKDKTLLIIEDDAKFAKILFDLAVEKGFKVLLAEDGEAGLALADQYIPSAIILDIGLPRMDGWVVMEQLKKNPKICNIPVHFMSAYNKSVEAMKMGAIGYLVKPVSEESLNNAFKKIENSISKTIKNLLIVENDKNTTKNIEELLKAENTSVTSTGRGEEALEILKTLSIDCMVLGLDLKDISSFKLIEEIRDNDIIPYLPIIIYTSRELTEEEDMKLRKYAESIIIKGVKSPERLLDEASLFLHRIEGNASEKKKKVIKMMRASDSVLNDKKLLLVDDDMRNVFALSSALEERGLKIKIGKNGKEALTCLKNDPNIDIVLMDIMMPEMDGYEATTEIRKQERFKKLPIIALTAKAMPGDRKKCIDAGANDYLAKPVDIDKLISLLKVWLYA